MTPSAHRYGRRADARRERQRRELLGKAATTLRAGDNRRAEALARRLLDDDAHDSAALDVIVEALLARGDVPSALYESERALLIAPRRASTLVTRARALLAASRGWDALDAARASVDLRPDTASWQMLVVALRSTGDVLGAVEAAEEMAARFPTHPGGLLLLGGLADEMGATEDALAAYGRALDLLSQDDPRHATIAARCEQLVTVGTTDAVAAPADEHVPVSHPVKADSAPPPQEQTGSDDWWSDFEATAAAGSVPPIPDSIAATGQPADPLASRGHAEDPLGVDDAQPETDQPNEDGIVDVRGLTGEPERRSLRVARWLDRLT